MVRKIVRYIFICLGLVFVMSQNVGAVSTVYDLSNYSRVNAGRGPSIKCYYTDDTTTNSTVCTSTYSKRIKGFDMSLQHANGFSYKKGDIIEFDLTFYASSFGNDLTNFGLLRLLTNNNKFSVIDYAATENTFVSSDGRMIFDSPTNNFYTSDEFGGVINFHIVVEVVDDYTGIFGITESGSIPFIRTEFYSNNGNLLMFLSNWNVYRKGTSDPANQEQAEATQDASDQATSDGQASQQSVDGQSQSLISSMGSIVTALTNAPNGDCTINVSTTGASSAFTSAIGTLNLCSNVPNNIRTTIQGIVALVFTPIVLYFLYNIVTKLYNLFKEYNS